jgi:sugar phosphate isomerase/epimerase
MALQWCFSTLGTPDATLDDALAIARRFGIDRIELRMLEQATDLPAYFAEHFRAPDALRQRLEEAGVRVQVLDTSLRLVNPDEADREAMLQFLPWAEAIGAPYLRVFDGGKYTGEPDPANIDAAAETCRWWQQQRRANGWAADIIVETHDFMCTSAACLAFEEAVDGSVGLLWDAHHIWFKAGEDVQATWAELRPHVKHIHVKDSVREPIMQYGYTYKRPGEGELPLAALLRRLEADGYDGAVSLEWERAWHPYLPPVEEALEPLLAMQPTD